MKPGSCRGLSPSKDVRPGPSGLGGLGLCCPGGLAGVLQAGLGAAEPLLCPSEDDFIPVLTGGTAAACSLCEDSLTRPVHVLPWGWQLFYQMRPPAPCRAGAGDVLFKSCGVAVDGIPQAQRE